VGELGRAGGDAGEVAVPEAGELQRVVDRAGLRAALGAARALRVLGRTPLVLLLGQVGELVGERRLDGVACLDAGGAGLLEQRLPRLLRRRGAMQRLEGGSKRTGWQREAIVGSTCVSRSVSSSSTT
jgi:hypothetical protein